mmetsp:Transcript_98266/g.283575  ORF Transcript_98266/g.283575 Transcript_98266/m.283575 type:complete len:175 (-) Transcript_98266:106-630(-)
MAPGGGKRGGRGRGDAGGARQGGPGGAGNGGGGGNMEARRSGGGRGIPEFKENPTTRRSASSGNGSLEGDQANNSPVSDAAPSSPTAPAQKFNAQEAAEWLASRYQAVVEEYDKQKQSGKKGDIQNLSDLNSERSAWSGSKPVIPPKEDFLHQLQVALAPFRQRGVEDQKGGAP